MHGFLMVSLLQPKLMEWGGVGGYHWELAIFLGSWSSGVFLTSVELVSTPGFPSCLGLGSSHGTWSKSRLCPCEGMALPLARQES